MKFDERNKKKSPFFISMATAARFVVPIPILLAYLVPLVVDVTGNITAKICEVWSEFNSFCTLVTMATAAILNLFNPPPPPIAATHYDGRIIIIIIIIVKKKRRIAIRHPTGVRVT